MRTTEETRVSQYSIWPEEKVILGHFLLVNQLDFVFWLFVTSIFDNFKKVELKLNHELRYEFYDVPVYPNMTRNHFVVGWLKSG